MHRRKFSLITGSLAALVTCLAASACTPGATATAGAGNAPVAAVTTSPAKIGHVTLRILDDFTGGADKTWMNDVIAAFEKRYPDITVQRSTLDWTSLTQELPLKLKSPDAPDIVTPNQGWQSLGTLVQGGLVDNLDGYATAYGWDNSVPSSILRQQEFTTNGARMGTGAVFGMPVARSSMIEVYYNRSLLRRLRLSVPTTFTQFTGDLATAKRAAITPVELGNLSQFGITEPLYSTMDALGSPAVISNLIYSQGPGSLDSPATGFPQAVAAMSDWAAKGYFTPQFAGVPEADAEQKFVNGQGLFHFDYSGSLPFTGGQSANFGSFVMPRPAGGPPAATMSSATILSVPSKSTHVAAAAAFLNFAASPAAAQIAVKLGADPMLARGISLPASNPEFADEVANANLVSGHNTSVPYLDWATPTLLNTISVQMQELLASKTSVHNAVGAIVADDAGYRAKLGK